MNNYWKMWKRFFLTLLPSWNSLFPSLNTIFNLTCNLTDFFVYFHIQVDTVIEICSLFCVKIAFSHFMHVVFSFIYFYFCLQLWLGTPCWFTSFSSIYFWCTTVILIGMWAISNVNILNWNFRSFKIGE